MKMWTWYTCSFYLHITSRNTLWWSQKHSVLTAYKTTYACTGRIQLLPSLHKKIENKTEFIIKSTSSSSGYSRMIRFHCTFNIYMYFPNMDRQFQGKCTLRSLARASTARVEIAFLCHVGHDKRVFIEWSYIPLWGANFRRIAPDVLHFTEGNEPLR